MSLYDQIVSMIGIALPTDTQSNYIVATCCVLLILTCWAIVKMVSWLFKI